MPRQLLKPGFDYGILENNSIEFLTPGGSYTIEEDPTSTNYVMEVLVGSFTLTGVNVIFSKTLNMAVSVGQFILTGTAVGFSKGITMIIDTANFILTGLDVIFKKQLTLAVSTASFVLTGFNISISKSITMIVATGRYILTGFPINLLYSLIKSKQFILKLYNTIFTVNSGIKSNYILKETSKSKNIKLDI